MGSIRLLSGAEQVAAHLRGEVLRERWSGTVPGIHQLAAELGVNHKTVKAALHLLEREGVLAGQGAGRRRRIEARAGGHSPRPLRVAILAGEDSDKRQNYMIQLQHALTEAGNSAFFAPGALMELGMNVRRVSKLVDRTEADAWVVASGSREVIEWFSRQETPSFALFGRRRGLPIAAVGPDKLPAYAAAVRRLASLGHQRIVLLVRPERRRPVPGTIELGFLAELERHGISTGSYNLPDWEDNPESFHRCLDALFQVTPPSAMILAEPPLLVAALQFCGSRGIRVPDDVSLLCGDPDPDFAWCRPSVAHIRWDSRPWVRRVVGWAANVSRGKDDWRQTLTKAEFVEGGTIGPVPKGAVTG